VKRSETSLSDILGEEFGPYKLVRRLGVGGMAETFVAVKSGPGSFTQRVCLKLVLPFFREDENFTRLFYREATLAAKLRHRNIVGVMDFGEFEGTPYMALELVDGLDLRGILDAQERQRLPADYVTLFGLELAEALQHAHNSPLTAGIGATADDVQGIVHRDISPSNVLVSRQGEILLTDFGVAKAISDTSRRQSAVKGKVPYMSPEQLRAESLDGRADLFALGVVLFEALAGARPYEGPHDPATIMLTLKGEHAPLQTLAPDAPPGLCDVIERLIDPDKEKRPATAAALIEAFDELAPSPRVRQNLGRLVRQLAEEAEQQRSKKGSGRISAKTEVLPDAGAGGAAPMPPTEPSSRVEKSASTPAEQGITPLPEVARAPAEPVSEPLNLVRPPRDAGQRIGAAGSHAKSLDESLTTLRDERRPAREARDGARPRRKLWLALAGSILGLGLAASAAVMFWPSGETSDPHKQEASQPEREPASEPKTQGEEPAAKQAPVAPQREPQPEPEAPTESEKAAEEPASEPIRAEPEPSTEPAPSVRTKTRPADEAKEPAKRAKPKPAQPKPEPQSKKPARLTISVFPWGKIWINGKPWGPAPLKGESMPPGTYKISVGQARPSKTQVVRLKAGQRKTLRFDLTAE
jgi:serine/threonine protein kinase